MKFLSVVQRLAGTGNLANKVEKSFISWNQFAILLRLSENAHLPRYPHPSSLRRTSRYASFLGISEALHLVIFHQPLTIRLFRQFRWSIFRPVPIKGVRNLSSSLMLRRDEQRQFARGGQACGISCATYFLLYVSAQSFGFLDFAKKPSFLI